MSDKLYTVRWPKHQTHDTKSVSGVLVETNIQGQVALHFYNEIRAVEDEVQYAEDGSRVTAPRRIVYERELTDSVLISENSARQLRNVLNALFTETNDHTSEGVH